MRGEKELKELLRQFVPYVGRVSEQLHQVIDKLSPKEAADLIIHMEAVDDLGNAWGAYDCGLASSYFILAAKNRGWDTLIMGMRDGAKVKAILGIPEGEALMSVIAVGKSAQKYMKRPRKPVAEVLKVR